MTDLKLDITQSLSKLEYICLYHNIPFYMIEKLKENSNTSKVILSKDGDKWIEKATIDKDNQLFIKGVNTKEFHSENTMYANQMLIDALNSLPEISIEPETDLDSILDKINKWGYNSLLEEEFKFLYNY
jgi:hypothetical protein